MSTNRKNSAPLQSTDSHNSPKSTRDPEVRRRRYLEGLSLDYANLRKDPKAAASLEMECALWDSTTGDGLSED